MGALNGDTGMVTNFLTYFLPEIGNENIFFSDSKLKGIEKCFVVFLFNNAPEAWKS